MVLFKIIGNESEKPCVFRIESGKKFFIWKSPELKKTLTSLSKDLDIKARKSPPSTDLFYKLATHIRVYRPKNLSIIVLFESENHAELIKFEMSALAEAENNSECLNNSFLPYKPKWINISENKAITETQPKSKVIAPPFVKKPKEALKIDEKPIEKDEPVETKKESPAALPLYDLKEVREAIEKLKKLRGGS